jgi:hypothetical protein
MDRVARVLPEVQSQVQVELLTKLNIKGERFNFMKMETDDNPVTPPEQEAVQAPFEM